LNKKGLKVSRSEYWKDWDLKQTQAAVCAAGFDKNIENWIWEREHEPMMIEWD